MRLQFIQHKKCVLFFILYCVFLAVFTLLECTLRLTVVCSHMLCPCSHILHFTLVYAVVADLCNYLQLDPIYQSTVNPVLVTVNVALNRIALKRLALNLDLQVTPVSNSRPLGRKSRSLSR